MVGMYEGWVHAHDFRGRLQQTAKIAGWSYKLFGFDERPNKELGAGMTQWIYGEQTNETT